MTTVLLAIQVIIVVFMIFVILLQKTGANSLAGLSGGGNSAFSTKTTSNALYKITIILAICFIVNSLVIAKIINSAHTDKHKSISESIVHDQSKKEQVKKIEAPEAAE